MSQLRYIGPEPRGRHDLARYSDIEMAQGNLLGHSQIQDVISEQMVQLNMKTTAEFDETRSEYALKSDLDSALSDYIPKSKYGDTVVKLDETGKIPRSRFQRVLKTDPSNVYSAMTAERSVNSGGSAVVSSINIPSQQTEFYALPFGTFYYAHAAGTNTSEVEILAGGAVIGRGETIDLSDGDYPGDYNTFGITVMPVPSAPLPPGTPVTIQFRFSAGYNPIFATAAKANPWCVICIPKGA